MSDNLPVPAGAGAPASDTLMTAIAMAAARIAAEQSRAPVVAVPLTREDVEAIAHAAVVEAFRQFGVDLTKMESVEAHRAVLDHARRSYAWSGKAASTVWQGVWAAIGAALIAAVVKYVSIGGGK